MGSERIYIATEQVTEANNLLKANLHSSTITPKISCHVDRSKIYKQIIIVTHISLSARN